MIGRTNAGSGGAAGFASISVRYPAGSTCTCTNGTKTLRAKGTGGSYLFQIPSPGSWTVSSTNGTESDSRVINIATEYEALSVELQYRTTPEFTYTGDYEIVGDADQTIADFGGWKNNWKIRFLTSGTFTVTNLWGFDGLLDVFVVGGGNGGGIRQEYSSAYGGCGGFTATQRNVAIAQSGTYEITIGAGTSGANAGASSGFGVTANGATGRTGGSGGAGCGLGNNPGGSDGNDGTGSSQVGTGQHTTTREFGETSGKLYAGGGGDSGYWNGSVNGADGGEGGGGHGMDRNATYTTPIPDECNGQANTGGGGGGGAVGTVIPTGGSGIVIIRNKR